MKPSTERQSRVETMLTDAVVSLCKNLLNYDSELSVEGLLGITVDRKEVLLVNINKMLANLKEQCDEPGDWKHQETLQMKKEKQCASQTSSVDHVDGEMEGSVNDLDASNANTSLAPIMKPERDEPVDALENNTNIYESSLSEYSKNIGNMDSSLFACTEACSPAVKSEKTSPEEDLSLENTLRQQPRCLTPVSLKVRKRKHKKDSEPKHRKDLGLLETDSLQVGIDYGNEKVLHSSDASPQGQQSSVTSEYDGGLAASNCYDARMGKYMCEHCPRTFSHKRSLWRHCQSHLGNHRHFCSICEKSFGRKDTLLRHMDVSHNKQHLKCQICDRLFTRRESVQRHILQCHGDMTGSYWGPGFESAIEGFITLADASWTEDMAESANPSFIDDPRPQNQETDVESHDSTAAKSPEGFQDDSAGLPVLKTESDSI